MTSPAWVLRRRYLKFGASLIHVGEVHERSLTARVAAWNAYNWRTRAACGRLAGGWFVDEPIGWRTWPNELDRVTCPRCLAIKHLAQTRVTHGLEAEVPA